MFHVDEIHLSHVIDEVEGKSKGPNTLVEGALSNKIKSITCGSSETLSDTKDLDVYITPLLSCIIKTNFAVFF